LYKEILTALRATVLTLALALQLLTLRAMLVSPLQLLLNHPLCCTHVMPPITSLRYMLVKDKSKTLVQKFKALIIAGTNKRKAMELSIRKVRNLSVASKGNPITRS
jgi:hypothetical protein